MPENTQIKFFEEKKVRSVWNEEEQQWYFVVVDVIEVLTDSKNPTDYIKKMRKRDSVLSEGWGQLVTPLGVQTAGGTQRINCANVKSLLRIIQSIPSPKAEPFKQWLAQVGYERMQEKPEDFEGNKDVARRGGNVAGVTRKETEKGLGHSVISSENFLNVDEKSNGTLPENNLPE